MVDGVARDGRATTRCAVHPGRLAADACPSCGRPRCAADAEQHATAGCAACRQSTVRPRRPPGRAEGWVRAGLAGILVALVGGWVATQYVGVHVMSLVAPALVGLAASALTTAAVGPAGDRRTAFSAAVPAALLGTALGFRFTIGGSSPLHPAGQVGPPYLAAVVGVIAWPLLFGTPGSRRRGSDQEPVDTDS